MLSLSRSLLTPRLALSPSRQRTTNAGSILDVDLRRRVPPLVYALLASLATETGFLVFATVLASRPLPECARPPTAATAAAPDGTPLSPARHPWASPAVAVRALVFTAWGSVALLLCVAALASAAAPDPADEAAWAARCRCLVLACCPAAAVPGGRAGAAAAGRRRGAGGAEAGASTTAAAAAAVVSSSAVAGGAARRGRPWWRLPSLLWPPLSKRRRSSRHGGRTASDAAGSSSSNPASPRSAALPPPASSQQQQQQLSLKQRTRSLDSTGAFDETSDGERNGDDGGSESNSEDDEEEVRGIPAPPYQRLGVLFKQVRQRKRERERKEGERVERARRKGKGEKL